METKLFLNNTVSTVIGCRETKGNRFGVELELEGRGVRMPDVATRGWNRHDEPSLRGESIEFTTAGSKGYEEIKKLNTELFSKFKENNVKLKDSFRAGTHVHLNFSDKPVKHVINFFALFTLLEEALQYYSGADRKGNLFCVSTREAEGIVGVLANAIARGDLNQFAGDRYKYAACNLSSLFKFGTVEIRTMKAAMTAEQINAWIDILNDMYVYSIDRMLSPADLVKNLSMLGAEGLMQTIFSPASYRELMSTFPAVRTLHQSLMEGARIIQVFAYNHEEDFLAKIELPKKRPPGKNRIPIVIKEGRFRGHNYAIYRPDGGGWNCWTNMPGAEFWLDGMALGDAPHIRWNDEHARFVYTDRHGNQIPCNWRRHHAIEDEGPHIMPLPVEEEFEPDFDEGEEI
jgi:hypothetical protein